MADHDKNSNSGSSSSDSYRFSSAAQKKRPRKMKIKQSQARKDDEGGSSSGAIIPPPAGPLGSPQRYTGATGAVTPSSPSPGLMAYDLSSSSSSSSSSSPRRTRRAGRKPQEREGRSPFQEESETHAPTLYDSYRHRSRSRSQGGSPKKAEAVKSDPSSSSSSSSSGRGWSSRSSNTPDDDENMDSGDEMYAKYRKYLSTSNEQEDADAPWRKKSKQQSPNKLGAPPALDISYKPPPPPPHQSASPTKAAKRKSSSPKEKIKSDKLPEEDLETIGNMLLMDDSEDDVSSTTSDHHQFVDLTSTDEDDMALNDGEENVMAPLDSSSGSNEGSQTPNVSESQHAFREVIVESDPQDMEEESDNLAPLHERRPLQVNTTLQAVQTDPTPYGGREVPLDESSATPSSRRTTPSSGSRSTPSSQRTTPSSGSKTTPSSKRSTPSSYSRSTPSSQRTTPSSGSSGGDSSFFSGSKSSPRRDSDESDKRRVDATAIATAVAVAAAVASEEKVPEEEPEALHSQSQEPPQQVGSVRDKARHLNAKSKKKEPARSEPKTESAEEDVSESIHDDSELWQQFVVDESNDVLETSFGQGSGRRGMENSAKSSLSFKKGGNDSLSLSEKSLGDSLPQQSPSRNIPVATPKVSNKKSAEDSLGSSLGNISVEDRAPIPPMATQSTRPDRNKGSDIEESLRVQDFLADSDSRADSGSLEHGGAMTMHGATQDDDEFSLKASQDLNNIEEFSENSEYDHKQSMQEFMSEELMNQGLQQLDTSLSTHDVETPGNQRKDATKSDSSSSRSESSSGISKKDHSSIAGSSGSFGLQKHIIRGTATLLLLAAIGLPLYFLIWYDKDDDNRDTTAREPAPPLFPPVAPVAPITQAPSEPPNLVPVPSLPPESFPTQPSVPPITAPSVTTPTIPPAQTANPSGSTTPGAAEDLRNFLISQWPSLEDDLIGLNTPQFFAYDWLLNDPGLSEYSEQRILQRFTLATLYFSTDGDNWKRNDRWLSNENECLWYSASGILPCNEDLAYNILNLPLNGLVGIVPSELALLSNSLTHIDLSSREGGGALSGSIPNELGFLSKLEVVDLSGNELQGSIAAGMGKWRNARAIDLSDNKLWGAFPSSFIHWTSLQTLDFSNNKLESSLPTSIGLLTSLRVLDLSGNSLTGIVPTEIGQLGMLHRLYLQENRFTSLPSEIGSLLFVEQLFAQENEIAGSIPSDIGKLVNLLALDLSNNALTSSIPPEIGNLVSIRDELNLSGNQLTGLLPEELGRLIFLRNLLLNANALTGDIPASFANLDRLVTLRLEDNALMGVVPEPVCAVYSETYPVFVTDCLDGEVICDCCMFCCSESGGCECQFADTDLSFLCAEFTKSPGLEDRINGNVLWNRQ